MSRNGYKTVPGRFVPKSGLFKKKKKKKKKKKSKKPKKKLGRGDFGGSVAAQQTNTFLRMA